MKNQKKGPLLAGLILVSVLIYVSVVAGQDFKAMNLSSDARSVFIDRIHLSDTSLLHGTLLTIPLSGLLSFNLSLSSVDTGQTVTGAKPLGAPPIPVTKSDDLRLYRLGAGFNFRF